MSMHSVAANGSSSETSSDRGSVFEREERSSDTSVSTSPSRDGNSRQRDPACIVGMACRVPGASRPSELWDHILGQRDVQRKMPEDRFNVDAFYHPNPSNKGTTNAKYGYFLDQDISLFDASFFNISGKEAEAMDPQHRLLLEVVYEALEDAGVDMHEVAGTTTSVYCGSFTNDYNAMTTKDLEAYPKYTVTGTGNSILSNRISYFYHLRGPSITIDTACSSSLTAFHLGAESLATGVSDMSIVVGSALHFNPNIFTTMTDLGMLSSDGRCRHGDANGSGYVRGEGICAVVLKHKRSAEQDGSQIHAVVRGTGINHDGKKSGITLPSPEAQEQLIRAVYERAELDPRETELVECHGTGTKAGDPREAQALAEVFTKGKKRDRNLWIGSVKTNIGHLEGASGLAGVIKAVYAVKKRLIAPNMHFDTPNPEIDWTGWQLQIPTKPIQWDSQFAVRRASVNSFGYGGSNAHVILEEYIPDVAMEGKQASTVPVSAGRPYLLPITSHTDKAGALMAERIKKYLLDKDSGVQPVDVAKTLTTQRTMHDMRSYAIGSSVASIAESLDNMPNFTVTSAKAPRLGFVFTGQGAQWAGMGKVLIELSPLFRQTLERCDTILQTLPDKPDWSVVAEISNDDKKTSRLRETTLSQPLCTALQLAIVDLVAAWGIKPTAVVGHSSGEMGAAYAAGLISFENAIVAAYYRGLYMGSGVERKEAVSGAMMAVGLGREEMEEKLQPYSGRVCVAAVNSPSSVTVSGDAEPITELEAKLTEEKIFARKLQVAQAFHSHHMQPLAPGYREALDKHPGFGAQEPKALMFSSVTARIASVDYMSSGEYWATNMVSPVLFSDALTGALLNEEDDSLRVDALVEIGPHAALKGPGRQVLQSLGLDKLPYIGSLARGQNDFEALLACAGQLYCLGYPVALESVNADHALTAALSAVEAKRGLRLIDFPLYAWDSRSYWAENRIIKNHRLRKHRHTLLGARVPGDVEQRPRWRNHLRLGEIPWLSDHVVEGNVVFPAAGYISVAIEAASRLQFAEGKTVREYTLKNISVKSPLVISNGESGTEMLVDLAPTMESAKSRYSSWYDFVVCSIDSEERYYEHCVGTVHLSFEAPNSVPLAARALELETIAKQSTRAIDAEKYYKHMADLGLTYGPTFQLMKGKIEASPSTAAVSLRFNPADTTEYLDYPNDRSIIHPSLLDAAIHPVFAAIESQHLADGAGELTGAFVPTFIKELRVSMEMAELHHNNTPFEVTVAVKSEQKEERTAVADMHIALADDGRSLIGVDGLRLTALGGGDGDDDQGRSLFFRTEWKPAFDLLDRDTAAKHVTSKADALSLYFHQHPDKRVLYVTDELQIGALSCVIRFVHRNNNGGRRPFRNLVAYCEGSHPELSDVPEKWEDRIELVADLEEDAEFDLIVVDAGTGSAADLQSHLAEAGTIIADADSKPSGLQLLWSASSLSAYRKPLQGKEATGEKSSSDKEALTVIMPTQHSVKAYQIADALASQASPATITRRNLLSLKEGDVKGGRVVILESVAHNPLANATDTKESHEEQFTAIKNLLTTKDVSVVWPTSGALWQVEEPGQAVVLGLARTARSENDRLRLVVLDTDVDASATDVAAASLQALDPTIDEDEIAAREGDLLIPRLVADDNLNSRIPGGAGHETRPESLYQDGRPLALRIGRPGMLDSLYWSEDREIIESALEDDALEIAVKASAINFRDIAASMGIIEDWRLGDECAGEVIAKGKNISDEAFKIGDRVVAWRPGQGAHRTVCRNPAALCYKLQGRMSYSLATALPLILTTAFYALLDTAGLRAGETVLVHAAAGGVGQMAVQIAHMVGAKVLATCGSPEKKKMLMETFDIPEKHIFSSRDHTFVKGVLDVTEGRGVDVVLNSLAGELLQASWDCVAAFGRFIEIGKRDIHQNSVLPMDPFRRNVSFASVDMITVFEREPSLGARVFQECCRLVHDGKISPPEPITEVTYAETTKGFRLLQAGKTTGKIVLVPSKGEDDVVSVARGGLHNKGDMFSPDKTYLLVGGLGGLGRALSQWLFRRGARSLAFFSRSGAKSQDAQDTLDWLTTRGVKTRVIKGDIVKLEDTKACVDGIADLGGVFMAAMLLRDAPLHKMSYREWQEALEPKVLGTYNLHEATKHKTLDFFVGFSSVSGVLGSKGQANYSAANNYIDALCQYRRRHGLPASTMNVGMIVGIGAVSENVKLEETMKRIGYDGVNEQELLAQIEVAATDSSTVALGRTGIAEHQSITGVNLRKPDYFWSHKPLFRNLYANHDFGEDGAAAGKTDLTAQLKQAESADERRELITQGFVEKMAQVLSVDASTISAAKSLASYGLDSIVAVEFRQWFFKALSVDVAIFEIMGSSSIQGLVDKAASMMNVDSKTSNENTSDDKNDDQQPDEAAAADAEQDATSTRNIPEVTKDGEAVPMSSFQGRMWYMHNTVGDPMQLNLPVVARMTGRPDPAALRDALSEMKRRNPTLRTSYAAGEDHDEQTVMDDYSVDLPHEDISKASNPEKVLEKLVHKLRSEMLNIEDGENMRVRLVQLADDKWALAMVFHHIAVDRASSESFLTQFTSLYDAIRAQSSLTGIEQPAVKYTDFSLWHNKRLESAELSDQVKFWQDTFAHLPAPSKLLPFAKAERPAVNDYRRNLLYTNIDTGALTRMKRIAASLGASPFHFLLAAFRSYIYRWTEDSDLTLLMIDGNRPHPSVNDVVGFFVNSIPIRSQIAVGEDTTFESLVRLCSKSALEGLKHGAVPFDEIVDRVKAEKSPSFMPLGQVAVNYQMHGTIPVYHATDFDITTVEGDDIPSACELALEAIENPESGLQLRLEYSSTIYEEADMERFVDGFKTFLQDAIKDHRQPLLEVNVCGKIELERLKKDFFNAGIASNYWQDDSVVSRIISQAYANPHAIAIETSSNLRVTYAEFVQQSAAVATSLQQAGIEAGSKIAIFASPGIEAITAMMGALMRQCGYVALDPEFAVERLAFMAADSGAPLVLVGNGLEKISAQMQEIVGGEVAFALISDATKTEATYEAIMSEFVKDGPFFTVYTSGSTGKPKGVVLSQENTQQMLCTLEHDYEFTPKDRFLQQSSISFDLSVVQIWSALTAGGCVCIATSMIRRDPMAMAQFMADENVTVTYFTPTQFALMIEVADESLRAMKDYRVAFFAGERLPVRVAKAFYDLGTPATLYNTWSPSELVVQTAIQKVEYPADDETDIPIGFPMANCSHYILDPAGHALPAGMVGELTVGGAQVGQGYLNRPDANRKAFRPDPFCSKEAQRKGWTRMFRTGDRGRFKPDGALEFHGRIAGDKQIKMRGYRIDLGEVEQRLVVESNALSATNRTGIKDISVMARKTGTASDDSLAGDNEQEIVAFVAPRKSLSDASAKRKFAMFLHEAGQQKLNSYMLPVGYHFLPSLPVTVGGKVDRQKLLSMQLDLTYPTTEGSEPAEPETPALSTSMEEVKLQESKEDQNQASRDPVSVVQEQMAVVLKLKDDQAKEVIGVDTDFFKIGGNSIRLVRLAARLKKAFKKAVPVQDLFKAASPTNMARLYAAETSSGKTPAISQATPGQEGLSFWEKEATLPNQLRLRTAQDAVPVPRSEVHSVLLTGADSFIGIHMLASILSSSKRISTVYVVGSRDKITFERLEHFMGVYGLVDDVIAREKLHHVRLLNGTLMEGAHFGLPEDHWADLADNVQAIFHCGSEVSLFSSYNELRDTNIKRTLDVLDLAAAASHRTLQTPEIHYLSTWSVPHLQSWSSTMRSSSSAQSNNEIIDNEASSAAYILTDDIGADSAAGYFPTRYIAERLLLEAAMKNGFPVTVFRASAVTASMATGISEPKDDLVRSIIQLMFDAEAVPENLTTASGKEWVVDFVPVDWLTNSLVKLATTNEYDNSKKQAGIFHLTNPSPMPLSRLAQAMPHLMSSQRPSTAMPLEKWSEHVDSFIEKNTIDGNDHSSVVWEVLKMYLERKHVMFAMDNTYTTDALRQLKADECPHVDEEMLKKMFLTS